MIRAISDVAKFQVSIKQRIYEARRRYFHTHDARPTLLYLGYEDFNDLSRECEPWEVDFRARDDISFMGMKVITVGTARHLNVSRGPSAT